MMLKKFSLVSKSTKSLDLLKSTGILSVNRNVHGLPPAKEYLQTAELPPIKKKTTKFEDNFQKLVNDFDSFRTVEEKMYYMNKPKYYGWYSLVVSPGSIFYGSLDFFQSSTWTHVVDGLPSIYDKHSDKALELAKKIAPRIQQKWFKDDQYFIDSILVPNDRIPLRERGATPVSEKRLNKHLKRQKLIDLDQIIQQHLINECPYLLESQVDYDSRTEGFWFRGGFNPDKLMVKKRLGIQKELEKYPYKREKGKMTDEEVYKKYDIPIQVIGKTPVKIRYRKMIPPFVDLNDDLCKQGKSIPEFPHNPRTLGYRQKTQHGINTPGHWTYSNNDYTNIQYFLNENDNKSLCSEEGLSVEHDRDDMLIGKGITLAFSQLLSQAFRFGFTPFKDPSHPLATQVILTNGETAKLIAFQLNKTSISTNDTENWLNNICWHSPEFKIIDKDETTGQSRVLEEGLAELIKFYLVEPTVEIENKIDTVFDVKNDYNRQYFYGKFNDLYSRRPPHFAKPEIFAWEKLHNIDHNNMFYEGLREQPWYKMAKICHRGKQHWHPEFRHIDYYRPKMVPRALRADKDKVFARKVKVPLPPDEITNQNEDENEY